MSEDLSDLPADPSVGYFFAQRKFIREAFANRRMVFSIFRHNYIYLHKDTWLGVVWIFVNPCIPIFIYNILQYMDIFTSNQHGIPRAVFLTVGLILYYSFSEALNGFTSFLGANKTFLVSGGSNKTAVICATLLVPFCNFLIRLLLFAVIAFSNQTAFNFGMLVLPIGCVLLVVLGTAFGLVLSVFNLITRDIANLVSMIGFYLLFASGVFGVIEPTNAFLNILAHSPIYMVIDGVRQIVFFGIVPTSQTIAVVFAVPIFLFSLSITAFYRVEYRINTYL